MYPVPTKSTTQGNTDRYIAKWLKNQDRSKIIVATKVAGASKDMTYLPGREGQGSRVRRKDILASVDASLERLGTDYIDLLQIHWPDRYVPLFGSAAYNISMEKDPIKESTFEEQLEALQEVVKAGKVRYIGVSNETPYGVMKFKQVAKERSLPEIISIQNSYSLLVRADYESGLTEVCSKRHENVGLLAYSPLGGGILSGKYNNDSAPSNSRFNLFPGYMERYKRSYTLKAVDSYVEIAKKYGLKPTELALAWCYSNPIVTSTIIGATTVDQLKENIETYEKCDKMTHQVLNDIKEVYKNYRDPTKNM